LSHQGHFKRPSKTLAVETNIKSESPKKDSPVKTKDPDVIDQGQDLDLDEAVVIENERFNR
jgi:hypothetical protein